MRNNIDTIIFDLGGVLVDWNPEYLYRHVFNGDQDKVNWFLNNICTTDWNVQQDAGRPLQEATELLIRQYPQYEEWIRTYYNRWEEMIGGAVEETVDLLVKLKTDNKYRLIALTNWSSETFPIAIKRFEFLKLFEGIVVSGEEKTIKPLPKIYKTLLDRYELNPKNCVFIDDNSDNIKAAEKFGIHGIHYKSPSQLKAELLKMEISF